MSPTPTVTRVLWDSVRDEARALGTNIGAGQFLPVLTCPRSSSCPDGLPSEAYCTRTVQRGICVEVDGACRSLVVSVIELKGCCCQHREEMKLTGKITEVTLVNKASNGMCAPVNMTCEEPLKCCCGFEEGNATTDVKQRNMSPLSVAEASGLGERRDGKQTSGEEEGLNELTEKQIKEGRNGDESDGGDSGLGLGEPTETQIKEERDREKSDGGDGGLSELTEMQITKDSVAEDIIAALVFLFVGVVLVLIKSRVFQFTKKKRQQEDKDMESQETLVDETVV